ncbi:MAG: phosphatidylglycerol lysyltransferase domain-containing protein [Vicinamibacteria bacterium]
MESLLVKYGYALLFAGIAVEGEAVLLAAGLLARHDFFRLPVVIAIAVAANAFADQFYFRLARQRGRAWVEKRFGQSPRFQSLMARMGRHAFALLVVSRFAYGLRIAIPAACGVVGMNVFAFTLADLVAGLLWAVPVAWLGYTAGGGVAPLLESVHRYEVAIAVALLAAAAAWLGLRRARRIVRWRELGLADAAALFHALVPFVVGLVGVLNVLSALWPREPAVVRELEQWLPLAVMQRSRALMLLAGVALLQVTRNLSRRKALAWWVAVGALAVSVFSHAGRAFDVHHSMVALALLGYFVVYRRRFQARSDPASLRQALLARPPSPPSCGPSASSGLDLADQYRWDEGDTPAVEAVRARLLTLDPGVDPSPTTRPFLGALQLASWAGQLYVLVLLLRPVILRRRQEAPAEAVARLVRGHGDDRSRRSPPRRTSTTCSWPAGERSSRSPCGAASPSRSATPCARARASQPRPRTSWRTVGGTAGSPASTRRPTPRFPSTGTAGPRVAEDGGRGARRPALVRWRAGSERPTVDGAQGHADGPRRLALRPRPRHRRRDRRAAPRRSPEKWLAEKRLGEINRGVRFSLESLDGVHVFVCRDAAERVVAFASWRPYADGRAAVLDLMRKRKDAPSGTMDLLVARSLEELRAKGLVEAGLANAPLANVGEPRGGARGKGVALLFENLNAVYGYKNLFQFKKKFAPRWEGRHLVFPGAAALPSVAVALTSLHGGVDWQSWRSLRPWPPPGAGGAPSPPSGGGRAGDSAVVVAPRSEARTARPSGERAAVDPEDLGRAAAGCRARRLARGRRWPSPSRRGGRPRRPRASIAGARRPRRGLGQVGHVDRPSARGDREPLERVLETARVARRS